MHGLETEFQALYTPLAGHPPTPWWEQRAQPYKVDLGFAFSIPRSVPPPHHFGSLKTTKFSDLHCSPIQNKLKRHWKQTLLPLCLKKVSLSSECIWTLSAHLPCGITKNTARKLSPASLLRSTLMSKLEKRNSVIRKVNVIIPCMIRYWSQHPTEMYPWIFLWYLLPTFPEELVLLSRDEVSE